MLVQLKDWADIRGAFSAEEKELLNRAVTGYDGGLPDTYGLRADRLAALMNDWKQRYGISPGSSSAGPGC